MTPTEKRNTLRRKLATRQEFIATFTKQDGAERTMRLRYEGGTVRQSMMQVRDLALNTIRTINLATVHTLWTITPKENTLTAQDMIDLMFD